MTHEMRIEALAGTLVLGALLDDLRRAYGSFDPCELLRPDARSELLPEHRVRQEGGGWTSK